MLSRRANERGSDPDAHAAVVEQALAHAGILAPALVVTHAQAAFDASGGSLPRYRLALVDALADSFDPALDRAAEALEAIEEQLVRGDAGALEVLLDHKRELLALRVRVSILREAVNGLLGYEKTLITPEGMGYWRDLYGSIARVGELAEASSEQASMALDLHLTAVNNALSVTMKRLTGITAVLALAGALAGLFGMSEAGLAFAGSEASGFWAISGLIVSICAAVALGLRRSRWI